LAQNRQLAAIMFTDIVGYTALMGKDEQKAFELLNKNRQIQKPLIEQYNGRWIKELGDGVMASFNTVSDAVTAAIKIQEHCNASKDFQLRVGIHLGEVVFENGDVFGDGVNISSRIQAIANPGTIYVSEAVYQNISNKKDIQTRFIKEEILKNVKEPVKIFEVLCQAANFDEATKKAMTPPPKNSIAVLPFANMSSDPEQEYFSDGITEEIITDLSHLHDMLVISRSSVMTFKNSSKKIKDIAAELNVHYVLEGSVRKAGNNLRITAQLIDAANDAHIWAEKYNGTLDDVFDIQEKVSRAIVDALKLKLTATENKQISERRIDNIHAYDCYLRARRELIKWNPEAFDRAKKYIENALSIIGPNEVLLGAMGYVHWSYGNIGIDQEENYKKAIEYANQAFAYDPESPVAHLVLGTMSVSALGDPLEALRHLKIILNNNPNDYDALLWSALTYILMGKSRTAREQTKRILALDPLSPISFGWPAGEHFYNGNFSEAIIPALKAFEMEPENPFWGLFVVLSYAYNSQPDEAIDFINKNLDPNKKGLVEETALMTKPALLNQKSVLLEWIPTMLYNLKKDYQHSHMVAALCAFAGLNDEALHWLENATNRGFWNYPFLANHETAFKELRNDSRYLKILDKVKTKWESVPDQE
jgi:TolB-like protein